MEVQRKKLKNFKLNFLGELPIDKNLRLYSDEGRPICISEPESNISKLYLDMALKVNNILQ